MKKNSNKQITDTLHELRRKKDDYIKESITKSQIVRKIGSKFADEILSHVKPVKLYGETRYLFADIGKYLNKNGAGRDIFVELVSGQSCFLPPVGKHRQGKLFIKS